MMGVVDKGVDMNIFRRAAHFFEHFEVNYVAL